MEIFTQGGGEMLSRWGHYLSGVTWIGLLYYFNFVQVPAFAEFEAAPRTEALRKLAPRALWWFRWGAVATLLFGILILTFQEQLTMDYLETSQGISIWTGILLAVVMFVNVWAVIWPNQRTVIASAEGVAAGREADPNAAAAGRRALLASRTNAMFSIPMLFFMGATAHFSGLGFDTTEGGDRAIYWVLAAALIAVLELNALGVFGTDPGGLRTYLDTHRNTIIAGFILAAVFILLFEGVFAD